MDAQTLLSPGPIVSRDTAYKPGPNSASTLTLVPSISLQVPPNSRSISKDEPGETTEITHAARNSAFLTLGSTVPWWPELLSWTASCATLAGIAGVLKMYNGKLVGEWKSTITLNAFLSVLVTLLYFFLTVPVSKSISQLKWNHFTNNHRKLQDIELFDEASRSAWGSLVFLMRKPKRVLASLAAFLTVAVVAIGPFIQQILTQEAVPLAVGNATVPIFNLTNNGNGNTLDLASKGRSYVHLTAEALYRGVVAIRDHNFDVVPTCLNANCSWDPFWTLTVEKECHDITDQLVASNWTMKKHSGGEFLVSQWTLPNGFHVTYPYDHGFEFIYNLTDRHPSIYFQHRGHALANFFFIDVQVSASQTQVVAFECVLQLAAQHIKAEYQNGVFCESRIGRTPFNNTYKAQQCSPWRRKMIHMTSWDVYLYDSTAIDLSGDEHVAKKGVDPMHSPDSCDIYVRDESQGAYLYYNGDAIGIVAEVFMDAFRPKFVPMSDPNPLVLLPGHLEYGAVEAFASIEHHWLDSNLTFDGRVDNIARSLTQGLRDGIFPDFIRHTATEFRDGIMFRITWVWISLPASLVALTPLLLVLTIWDTNSKGLQKWTDSSLAVVRFSGNDDLVAGADLAAIRRIAKTILVTLEDGQILKTDIVDHAQRSRHKYFGHGLNALADSIGVGLSGRSSA